MRQSGGDREEQEEKTKFQPKTKKTEGVASKQGHAEVPQGTPKSPQMSESESPEVPNKPEPLREKETQCLVPSIPGQNPDSKVPLPARSCQWAVYDIFLARSRSALQFYLKRQEGRGSYPGRSPDNPFSRMALEFGSSLPQRCTAADSQRPSTIHFLSQLLRLRQCCCHLSLLKLDLNPTELESKGLVLSLEEQLNALTLSKVDVSEPSPTVSLNGTCLMMELFDDMRRSTKVSSLLAELEAIQKGPGSQKSVTVSQWTSMLQVIALHLKKNQLTYATIDGSVNPKQRMDLEAFKHSQGPQVMLISLLVGSVGLNLTGGNHLFLLDMYWHPSLEDQACDQIY